MKRLVAFVCLLLLSVGVFSSIGIVFAAYDYSYPIEVFNNGSTSYANGLPVLVTINNSQVNSYGYIDADGLDTLVQEGASSRESMVHAARLGVFFPSFTESQERTINYRLGNTPARTTLPLVVGLGGNVTVSDAAALELGDNGTIALSGYIDTSVTSMMVRKSLAYAIMAGSGNITAAVLNSTTSAETLRPNGPGSETNIASVYGASTHWRAVGDNAGGSYVFTTSTTYQRDLYTLVHSNTTRNRFINSVTIYFRIQNGYANGTVCTWVIPHLVTYSTVYNGTAQSQCGGAGIANKSQTYSTNPYTSAAWTWDEVDALGAGVSMKTTSASGTALCYEVWVNVNYEDYAAHVTATGVSVGEHIVNAQINSPFLSLGVDVSGNITPVADGLRVNAPWFQTELSTNSTTIDSNAVAFTNYGATWTGQGYSFVAGESDELTVDMTSLPDINSTDFTLEMWIYGDTSQSYAAWAGANVGAAYTTGAWMTFTRFLSDDGSLVDLVYDPAPTTLAWNHIVVTHSLSTKAIEAYVNGAAAGSTTYTGALPATNDILYLAKRGTTANYLTCTVGEVRVYGKVLSPTEVTRNYNATKAKYTSGDVDTYSTLVSVPDNSNDLLLADGDVVYYMNWAKLSVDGTQQMWFEPNTMLAGTVLTDRQGADNNGSIGWGSNPSSIEVSFGGLVASATTVAATGTSEEAPDLLDAPPTFEYVPEVAESDLVNMPMYGSVAKAAESTGMTTKVMYVLLMQITCLAIGFAGLVALGSGWGFVGGYLSLQALALGTPVRDLFFLITIGFILVLGIFLWRRY